MLVPSSAAMRPAHGQDPTGRAAVWEAAIAFPQNAPNGVQGATSPGAPWLRPGPILGPRELRGGDQASFPPLE